MDYNYSELNFSNPIGPTPFDGQGFAEGFPARRHNDKAIIDAAYREARADWVKLVGTPIDNIYGCLSHSYGSFAELIMPMHRPERLRIIAYSYEYHFLHDSITDTATQAETDAHAPTTSTAEITDLPSLENRLSGRTQIKQKMMRELKALDPVCAQPIFEEWRLFLKQGAGRDKTQIFPNLEKYLDYRYTDSGLPWVAMCTAFGLGVALGEKEREVTDHILRAWTLAFALANDYFSFDVEYEQFNESGATTLTNVVWLVMKWDGVDIKAAKAKVKTIVLDYEKQLHGKWREFMERKDEEATPELKYVTALAHHIRGNYVWASSTPRYNAEAREEFDEIESEISKTALSTG
ncbi:terpenoid synthase [Lepidopterella palustris CBS 459.81]|uniref:Terpenoid synthase n=1 Tax=Lepidopterella palustris CBS 459.81 TaxID=1314670 RepID=A0A8E2JF38_9PEZI|nr:terpenoid synthase [Lepidopterella palustris CBS 459.81]